MTTYYIAIVCCGFRYVSGFCIFGFWFDAQVCFGLMSEDGSCGIVSGADDKSSPKCTPRSGWDGLARPAFDKTGRVCHSPISPILARAWQYLDELPDSVDSGGSVADYHEDEESLAEALQSACRSEHSVSLPRMSVPISAPPPRVRRSALIRTLERPSLGPSAPAAFVCTFVTVSSRLLRKKRSVWTARKVMMEAALDLDSESRSGILASEGRLHKVTPARSPSPE